jgi:hypothetical protein
MCKNLITPVTVSAVALFFGLAAIGAWAALGVVAMVRPDAWAELGLTCDDAGTVSNGGSVSRHRR